MLQSIWLSHLEKIYLVHRKIETNAVYQRSDYSVLKKLNYCRNAGFIVCFFGFLVSLSCFLREQCQEEVFGLTRGHTGNQRYRQAAHQQTSPTLSAAILYQHTPFLINLSQAQTHTEPPDRPEVHHLLEVLVGCHLAAFPYSLSTFHPISNTVISCSLPFPRFQLICKCLCNKKPQYPEDQRRNKNHRTINPSI